MAKFANLKSHTLLRKNIMSLSLLYQYYTDYKRGKQNVTVFTDHAEALATLERKLRKLHPMVSENDITELRQKQAFAIKCDHGDLRVYILVEMTNGKSITLTRERCRDKDVVLEELNIDICYEMETGAIDYVRCPFPEPWTDYR